MTVDPNLVQFARSPAAMQAAPILVLLPVPGVAPPQDKDPKILGLSLVRRAVLAARRAGYGRVFLLTEDGAETAGAAAIPDWSRLAAIFRSSGTAPMLIAPASILAETEWLERLAEAGIEAAGWTAIPNRIVMIAAAAAPDALVALGADGGARDFTAAEGRLARRFGAPATMPAGIDPMLVERPADVPAASGASFARWSRTPTASWRAMSSGQFHCNYLAASRPLRSRPTR